MLSPADFREIVSGRRKGAGASLARATLSVLEIPYSAVMRLRNRRFDRGRAVQRVAAPVVSVGNLTLGGTGKTPFVEWLATWFTEREMRVAIVSRGYGGQHGKPNDEALELTQKLPGIVHLQDPDRVSAARRAIAEHGAQIILLDDGFQHRRLARDLDIVLVDAAEPFGFEHVFPRGALREPLDGFARAQVVALSRADMRSPDERAAIQERVRQYNPDCIWLEMAHVPRSLRTANGELRPLESLRGRRVLAFCGIGNPQGFRHVLERCGYQVIALREFPDHYSYTAADIEALSRCVRDQKADAILCTHKDLVKLSVESLSGCRLFAMEVGLKILAGQEELEEQLSRIVASAQSGR